MITAFKKHMTQPWHKISKNKRVYEQRGKYFKKINNPFSRKAKIPYISFSTLVK